MTNIHTALTTAAHPEGGTVTLADIRAAHDRIRSGIYRSPCPQSIPLSDLTGCRIWCKLDLLQRTGSFKERGARNALLLLDAAQRAHGVVAASAGNHALGLAYHGKLLGIPVTVVMPRFAPLVKVATRSKTLAGWLAKWLAAKGSISCTASTTPA